MSDETVFRKVVQKLSEPSHNGKPETKGQKLQIIGLAGLAPIIVGAIGYGTLQADVANNTDDIADKADEQYIEQKFETQEVKIDNLEEKVDDLKAGQKESTQAILEEIRRQHERDD